MQDNKLNILHLLSQRPDSTGSGIYVQAMMREAASRNHRNYLLAGIQSNRPADLDCIAEDQCAFVRFGGSDISYRIVGMSDVMPYRSKRFCDLGGDEIAEYENGFAKKLKTVVKRFKPDIIHSHHLWILSSLARRICPDLPIATTCHGSDLRQFQNCRHLQKKVLNGCRGLDAVMALSEVQKNEIRRLYDLPSKKLHVVGAGYNEGLFSQSLKPEPCPVQVVYAGKLSNAKGVPWLLRALARIDAPAWRLHLVGGGSGPEKENCLQLAQGMGERVRIHGAVNQQQLAAIIKQSHVFVLPSFYEGLPLVVLEALAGGCRVVANDLPGTQEILGNAAVDVISFIRTPRLQTLDAPFPDEEKPFEARLEKTLRAQMAAAVNHPQIDLSPLKEKLAAFSWSSVFERVQRVYFEAIRSFVPGIGSDAPPAEREASGSPLEGGRIKL
jgi:glycosyltransferase involved in cell wall biosynthesis